MTYVRRTIAGAEEDEDTCGDAKPAGQGGLGCVFPGLTGTGRAQRSRAGAGGHGDPQPLCLLAQDAGAQPGDLHGDSHSGRCPESGVATVGRAPTVRAPHSRD